MKNLIFIVVVGLGFCGQLFAEMKVAVIDPLEAMAATKYAQAQKDEVTKSLAGLDLKAFDLKKRLDELQSKISKDGFAMSVEERNALEVEGRKTAATFNQLIQEMREKQQAADQEILKVLHPRFQEALNEMTEAKDFDVVLIRQSVLYMKPGIDITKDVTAKINELDKK